MRLKLVGTLGLVLGVFSAAFSDGVSVGTEHLLFGIGGLTEDKLASGYLDTLLLPGILQFGAVFLSGNFEEFVCQVARLLAGSQMLLDLAHVIEGALSLEGHVVDLAASDKLGAHFFAQISLAFVLSVVTMAHSMCGFIRSVYAFGSNNLDILDHGHRLHRDLHLFSPIEIGHVLLEFLLANVVLICDGIGELRHIQRSGGLGLFLFDRLKLKRLTSFEIAIVKLSITHGQNGRS